MRERIEMIPLELIDRPVKIAREIIDPEKVRELAESIREVGLLEPVILRSQNGRYEMVAGDRRFLAHKLLGEKEIKAIVKKLDERETVIIRGIENLQRVDLTPSEEARTYVSFREEGGLTLKQISKKTGKSETTIIRYLNLAKHPEEVRRAVDRKEISILCLETLREVDDDEAFMYFFKMAVSGGISEKVARSWVDDYAKTKNNTYYGEDGTPSGSNVEVEVKPVFMTCEICLGPIEIRKAKNIVACPDCRRKVIGRSNA